MRIYSLCFVLCFFLFSSCGFSQYGRIEGEGPKVERDLDLSTIDGIALSINAEVTLTQGNTQGIRMVGQENILDNIETNVSGGTWKIKFKQRARDYDKVEIYITMAELEEISIAGSGSVTGKTPFRNLDDLELSIAGSGDITLDVEAEDIEFNDAGSGNGYLKGTADDLAVNIAGSGDFQGEDLQVRSCEASIAGSGNCKIRVSDAISANIVGSGDVVYYGNPDQVKSSSLGSGKLKARN